MGYPELLRVLQEEAAREARDVGAAAAQERDRVLAEAHAEAVAARAAAVARARVDGEQRRRAALEAIAVRRERAILVSRRRELDGLREEAERRLAAAGSAALDARLLAEVLPEAGEGPLEVVVDPGAAAAARAALSSLSPAAASRATVREAPARRGGVEVIAGRRVLDDTLPSRLARAWPELEAELASILFGGG